MRHDQRRRSERRRDHNPTPDHLRQENRMGDILATALGVDRLDELRRSLDKIETDTNDVDGERRPAVPDAGAARKVLEAFNPPFETGDRVVKSLSVTSGNPQHGAMMSGAHVSTYEVEYTRDERCENCNYPRAVFEIHRHHNIAGNESIRCANCKTEHQTHEWS